MTDVPPRRGSRHGAADHDADFNGRHAHEEKHAARHGRDVAETGSFEAFPEDDADEVAPVIASRPRRSAPTGQFADSTSGGKGAESGERPITLGGHDLPHWTDPPTGQVPKSLGSHAPRSAHAGHEDHETADDMAAWHALGNHDSEWSGEHDDWEDVEEHDSLGRDDTKVGAVDSSGSGHPDDYSFDEDFERLEKERAAKPRRRGQPDRAPTGSFAAQGTTQAPSAPEDEEFDEHAGMESPETTGQTTAPARRPTGANQREPVTTAPGTAPGPGRRPAPGGPQARPGGRPAPRPGGGGRPPGPQGPGGPFGNGGGGGASRSSSMGERVAVGAGLIVAMVIFYLVGPAALAVFSAVVIGAAAIEGYGMLQRAGFRPATLLGLVASIAVVFAAYWRGTDALALGMALVLIGSMIWYMLGVVEARPLANVAVTVFMFVWVGVLGSFSTLLLRVPKGGRLFLGVVVVTIASDIVAYFVGSSIGRRQIAPSISPGKTWEGATAGLVAALIAGAIFGKVSPWGGIKHGLLFGLLVAIVAPLGDLAQSMIKRDLGIKDSGALLPGHGGVLDRFDTMLFTLPLGYFFVEAVLAHGFPS